MKRPAMTAEESRMVAAALDAASVPVPDPRDAELERLRLERDQRTAEELRLRRDYQGLSSVAENLSAEVDRLLRQLQDEQDAHTSTQMELAEARVGLDNDVRIIARLCGTIADLRDDLERASRCTRLTSFVLGQVLDAWLGDANPDELPGLVRKARILSGVGQATAVPTDADRGEEQGNQDGLVPEGSLCEGCKALLYNGRAVEP